MANLRIAWVKMGWGTRQDGAGLNQIQQVISSEVMSFTSSTQSSVAPAGATAAIVKPDTDAYVTSGASPTASSTSGVHVTSGHQEVFAVTPGTTKIAAVTA